jgi:hypothetical protein
MMIKRTKGIEIDELHFYNAIQHLRFKHVFNHRNHKFWRCVYRKVYSFLVDKTHQHIIDIMIKL